MEKLLDKLLDKLEDLLISIGPSFLLTLSFFLWFDSVPNHQLWNLILGNEFLFLFLIILISLVLGITYRPFYDRIPLRSRELEDFQDFIRTVLDKLSPNPESFKSFNEKTINEQTDRMDNERLLLFDYLTLSKSGR